MTDNFSKLIVGFAAALATSTTLIAIAAIKADSQTVECYQSGSAVRCETVEPGRLNRSNRLERDDSPIPNYAAEAYKMLTQQQNTQDDMLIRQQQILLQTYCAINRCN